MRAYYPFALNYRCGICGVEFGRGGLGRSLQSGHFREEHLKFYNWRKNRNQWENLFAVYGFAYVGLGFVIGSLSSLRGLANWWFLGFTLMMGAVFLYLADSELVIRRFRRQWLLTHPEDEVQTIQMTGKGSAELAARPGQRYDGEEEYIGGFMAGGLKKKGNFAGGYGIYFTNQRIVGVKPGRWFILLLVVAVLVGIGAVSAIGVAATAIFGSFSPAYSVAIGLPIIAGIIAWGQRKLKFQTPKTIEELERRKDFEIRREAISQIEMKGPGAMRRGHLIITPGTGKSVTIMINQEPGNFGRLKVLITRFCGLTSSTQMLEDHSTAITPQPRPKVEAEETASMVEDAEETVNVVKNAGNADFEWCAHCATAVPRTSSTCPNCGRSLIKARPWPRYSTG